MVSFKILPKPTKQEAIHFHLLLHQFLFLFFFTNIQIRYNNAKMIINTFTITQLRSINLPSHYSQKRVMESLVLLVLLCGCSYVGELAIINTTLDHDYLWKGTAYHILDAFCFSLFNFVCLYVGWGLCGVSEVTPRFRKIVLELFRFFQVSSAIVLQCFKPLGPLFQHLAELPIFYVTATC